MSRFARFPFSVCTYYPRIHATHNQSTINNNPFSFFLCVSIFYFRRRVYFPCLHTRTIFNMRVSMCVSVCAYPPRMTNKVLTFCICSSVNLGQTIIHAFQHNVLHFLRARLCHVFRHLILGYKSQHVFFLLPFFSTSEPVINL
jgi:hypothetical protein